MTVGEGVVLNKEIVKRFIKDATTTIKAIEINKSISTLTMDHMIKEQIVSLKGSSDKEIIGIQNVVQANKVSLFDQLQEIKDNMTQVVAAVERAGDDKDALATLGIVGEKEPT